MANIDKVFMSICWEALFPALQLKTLPRAGSDHTPLVFDTCALQSRKIKLFRFEKWWLEIHGFEDSVKACWTPPCALSDPLERWQFKIRRIRKMCKGWNAN